jgi:4-oxalocrotonate tautomerase
LIQGVTDLVANVLEKKPKTTVVIIDEISTDNGGIGGESVTELRRQKN